MKRTVLSFGILLFIIQFIALAAPANQYHEKSIYTKEYGVSFYPEYPPVVGKTITVRLRTFEPAQKVSLYTDREEEIPLRYEKGHWWGKWTIPDDYQVGRHFFTVWIKYIRFKPTNLEPAWSKSTVWYRMAGAEVGGRAGVLEPAKASEEAFEFTGEMTPESGEEPIISTGEAMELAVISPEALPLLIKGSKTLSFSSKSIEGSKEGFIPGMMREEGLRLNISGGSDDMEIEGNLISTSNLGTSQVSQREEKMSVLIKKASTEAYLGDFTADLTETEFARLNKVLSGARVKGDYGGWGFNAVHSSPKGESMYKKIYGDGTQGPYQLDASPVVIDSDRVYVDGLLQKRGDDYTIDYQAGTVTFTRKTIDPKSILDLYYDYRQTVYQHATYGLRLFSRPNSNLKIGATYLNDSDSLAGAQDIRQSMTQEAVDPQSHYVVGADGAYVSDLLTANGEVAYSSRDLNLLSSGSEEAGKAVKLELSSQLGPLGITARGKRVGARFLPVAESNPKQDVTDYALGLSFRPGSLFGLQGNHNYDRYTQSGVIYENTYKNAKASLTPERWPSLDYNFSETGDSNDPVTGNTIQRTITRNSAETNFRLGFLSSNIKGTTERWLSRSPSEEVTSYRRANVGLATVGIEKITFASNVELEDRDEPSGATPHRKTYDLNLSITPLKSFFISSSIDYIDDSEQGVKNVTDVSYRFEPLDVFKTDGKYTVTTVNEDFATTETVAKNAGSFSLDLRPAKFLRLKYLYKPNYTVILRTGTTSYNNEQQQTEINVIPFSEMMIGMLRKSGRSFNVMTQDFTLKNNTSDTDSTLYTLKMAPFRIFSTEFDYLLESGKTTTFSTSEPLTYIPGQSSGTKFDAIIKTSLSEKFSIDSRYTYQLNQQGSGEADNNITDGVNHTASLKGVWNISDAWSVSLSGAYTKAMDYIAPDPLTYTYSPGFGFIFRLGQKLRVDFDYTYSKSYAGAVTEMTNYSLRGKYSLSDYVNITLRGEHEISRSPDYRLTDISGNVEINL